MMERDVIRHEMTFIDEIEQDAAEIKKQLKFREMIAGEDTESGRPVSQPLAFDKIEVQKTDNTVAREVGRFTTISPVEYQEPCPDTT